MARADDDRVGGGGLGQYGDGKERRRREAVRARKAHLPTIGCPKKHGYDAWEGGRYADRAPVNRAREGKEAGGAGGRGAVGGGGEGLRDAGREAEAGGSRWRAVVGSPFCLVREGRDGEPDAKARGHVHELNLPGAGKEAGRHGLVDLVLPHLRVTETRPKGSGGAEGGRRVG
jgi:hypothetical protein